MIDLDTLLKQAIEREASDVHIKTGSPPMFRVDGVLEDASEVPVGEEETEALLDVILKPAQKERFSRNNEIDLSYSKSKLGRFRTNIYRQRGSISIAMRHIKSEIPSFQELNLPPVLKEISMLRRGLVLFTGTTGSGKSTSLAACIDYINERRRVHVVTIEDPIEYLHTDKLAIINQREVLIDTDSFATALKTVMRQDPDVILIGEMRDITSFKAAMAAAETGHLVFSTLHTSDAIQTIDRIVDLFPSNQQDQVRSELSQNLQAIVCQRLIMNATANGRVPACEILLSNPAMRKLIRENRVTQLTTVIQSNRKQGMQTFNDSLVDLVQMALITQEEAARVSDNPDELLMNLQGIYLSRDRGGILR